MSQVKRIFQHDSKPVNKAAVLTYTIPSFEVIDDIVLEFKNAGAAAAKANILTSINKIALAINGEQVINCKLSQLYDVYASLGQEVTQNINNVIGLNIGRYLFKDPVTEDYFAYGCANVQTIQLQVYCAATVTDVTDLSISTIRRNFKANLGSYIKIINYPQNMNSTGISSVDTLPRDANEAYLSIMANAGGGTISQGECVVNGNNIYDPMTAAENDYIVSARGLAPVSGTFNYSFSDGSIKSILPMQGVTELRLKTTFSAAPTSGSYDLLAVSIRNVPSAMMAAVSA
ncbi:MAG: hypothetical protein BHW57_02330 [Azospirillum sp. 47_25]|nr:MAG: hypothetical protein BHW57_02330 [Azospirillum sp. 47_25]